VVQSISQAAHSSHPTAVSFTHTSSNDRQLVLTTVLEELSELLDSGQNHIADILKSRHPEAYDELRPLIPILELLVELKHNDS
jgi:hypothetical protein